MQLFGGWWYYCAVFETMDCWIMACKRNSFCSYTKGKIFVNSGDYRFLDEMCSTEDSILDFGIFKEAVESRIVWLRHFGTKFLFSFRWGIQNIR